MIRFFATVGTCKMLCSLKVWFVDNGDEKVEWPIDWIKIPSSSPIIKFSLPLYEWKDIKFLGSIAT